MIEFLLRHRTGLTFVTIVLVLLSAVAAQVPTPDHPSLLAWGLYAIVSPIQQGIAYSIVGAADLWAHYVGLQEVESENTELKAKVADLYEENQRLRETLALAGGEMELDAFSDLYEETYGYRGVKAMIIGAGLGGAEHTVLVNKGVLDGVKREHAVISPTGVVGTVIRVGPTSCLVQLVTDVHFAMAARLQGSRVRGVLRGTGGAACKFDFIRDTDAVDLGDRIVSSGLERIFPRGILAGRVTGIRPGQPPLRDIEVAPSADLRSLEWVLIVQWHEEISDLEF